MVYFGGNSKDCASDAPFVRQVGWLSKAKTLWKLEAKGSTRLSTNIITTSGRKCLNQGESTLITSRSLNTYSINLSADKKQITQWLLSPVNPNSCSVVNIIDLNRKNKKLPAYLSVSSKCANAEPFLAAKDNGQGYQRWSLVKKI